MLVIFIPIKYEYLIMQTESKQTLWMLIAEYEAAQAKHEQTILFKHTGMNNVLQLGKFPASCKTLQEKWRKPSNL